jgi:hypothetical protein
LVAVTFSDPSSGVSIALTDEYGLTANGRPPLSVVTPLDESGGGPLVVAPPPPPKLYIIDMVAKSFINGISAIGNLNGRPGSGTFPNLLSTFGNLPVPLAPPLPTAQRLSLFAGVSNLSPAFHQNPRTPAMDGSYRLFTRVLIGVNISGNTIINWTTPTTFMDAGQEAPFISGTINMTAPVVTRINASTIDVWWKGWGHPNNVFEPAFQYVALRTSTNIWHQVDVHISASGGAPSTTVMSFLGSAFPSRRLWINGIRVKNIAQGALSDLWQPDPTNPWWVAQ